MGRFRTLQLSLLVCEACILAGAVALPLDRSAAHQPESPFVASIFVGGTTISAAMPPGRPETSSLRFRLSMAMDGEATIEARSLGFDTGLRVWRLGPGGDRELGMIDFWRGRLPRAEQYLRRAAEIHLRPLGSSHQDTPTSLDRLSDLMRAMGRNEEAEALAAQAGAARGAGAR